LYETIIIFNDIFINKENSDMKRKNIILAIVPILFVLFALQSCNKDNASAPVTFKAAVPENPTPAASAVLTLSGTAYVLKWDGTTATSWDVYAGTSANPPLVKSGVSANTYTLTETVGGHYYWYVKTKDANNVISTSDIWDFYINSAPAVPVLTSPAANAVKVAVGATLTWTATDPEGDALTYDVYLGTTSTPGIVAAGISTASYVATMLPSTVYYWKVVAKDPFGYSNTSVVKSFTTGVEAIMTYTGNYTVDEPAEGWTYPVALSKGSSTTVNIDQYWASWPAVFTINFTTLTYSMALTTFTSGYSAIESGTIDPTTGTLSGSYTIWHNTSVAEQGFHTYTKN
jgi:hypothetical protein